MEDNIESMFALLELPPSAILGIFGKHLLRASFRLASGGVRRPGHTCRCGGGPTQLRTLQYKHQALIAFALTHFELDSLQCED